MKSKLFLSLLLLLTALSLSAVPARPGRLTFVQPDGSTIVLSRHGDEWGHWLTDAQGRTVVKGADGYYRPVSESQAQSMRRQATTRRAEARRRLSLGSAERQTAQLHPTIGTPEEVPEPSIVSLVFILSLQLSFRSAKAPRASVCVCNYQCILP